MEIKTFPRLYAFPLHGGIKQIEHAEFCGMTLRDYFAAKALIGIMCGSAPGPTPIIAKVAYVLADEMMKARHS